MAESVNRTSTRAWRTDPTLGDMSIVVRKVVTTRNVGLPDESTEEDWSARLEESNSSMVICEAASEAEMDAKLNAVRQIIVEARAGLATM